VAYNIAYHSPNNIALLLAPVWIVPGLTMSKIYSNSMLALLNSRLTIVGGRNMADPFDISEIRSEVLRTEIGEDPTTSAVTRRKGPNVESSEPV